MKSTSNSATSLSSVIGITPSHPRRSRFCSKHSRPLLLLLLVVVAGWGLFFSAPTDDPPVALSLGVDPGSSLVGEKRTTPTEVPDPLPAPPAPPALPPPQMTVKVAIHSPAPSTEKVFDQSANFVPLPPMSGEELQKEVKILESVVAAPPASVAFLFLNAAAQWPAESIWRAWLADAKPSDYSLHVHTAPDLKMPSTSLLAGHEVKDPILTKYAHRSVMQASLMLLREAFDSNPEAQFFALMSSTCVPLRPFKFLQRYLSANNASFLDSFLPFSVDPYSGEKRGDDWTKYRYRNNPGGIPGKEIRKGSQWWILSRRHAASVLEPGPKQEWLRIFLFQVGVSNNEHTLQNFFVVYPMDGFINDTLTFARWHWEGPQKNQHPKPFSGGEKEYRALIEDADRRHPCMKRSCYLFARKWVDEYQDISASLTHVWKDSLPTTIAQAIQ